MGCAHSPSNFGSEPKKPTNTEHPNFGTTSDSSAKRQAVLSLSNKGWEIQLFPCRWLSWPWINAGWELGGSTREVLAYRQHRGDLLSQLSYCLTQAAVHPGQVTTSQPLADGSVLLLNHYHYLLPGPWEKMENRKVPLPQPLVTTACVFGMLLHLPRYFN